MFAKNQQSLALCLTAGFWMHAGIAAAAVTDRSSLGAKDIPTHYEVTLHVANTHDGATDAEANTGENADQPLVTMNRSLEIARQHLQRGRSVQIKIGAGVYQEMVDFRVSSGEGKARETPLAILGDPDGGTYFRGSDSVGFEPETWSAVEGHPDVFEHVWLDDRGIEWGPWGEKYGVFLRGVTARSELVFVNDQLLKPVELEAYRWTGLTSKELRAKDDDDGQMKGQADAKLVYDGVVEGGLDQLKQPWTFAVADRDESPEHLRDRLFIRLPEGETPQTIGRIEVGLDYDFGWEIRGKDNVVMKDITIERYATPYLGQAFKLTGVNNGYFENILVRHNSGKAYGLGDGGHLTFINCDVVENGGRGFGGTRFANTLIQDCNFDFNNWRGVLGGFTGWDTSAVKITRTRNVLFSRCTAVGNAAHGFWTDVFNGGVTFEKCFSYGNWRRGIFFELSGDDVESGDDHALQCVSAYNGEYGIMAMNVRRPVIENCLVFNNADGQIALARSGKRPPFNAAGFEWIRVINNTVISQNDAPAMSITAHPDHGGRDLISVLQIDRNRYVTSNPSDAFTHAHAPNLNFEQWRSLLTHRDDPSMNDESSTLQPLTGQEAGVFDLTNPDSEIVRQSESLGVTLPVDAIKKVTLPLPAEKADWDFVWAHLR